MANPNIRVDVDGNTAKLRRQIDQVAKQGVTLNIQTAGGAAQPLGKISGQIQEIDKSLAAANARVIAFAASAGAIFAIQSAVTSLFNTFVNVEKKLADVNVLLNLTDRNLAKFGASLFDIAGNTAQSFDVVAEAATELSRQGLGVEETLKRTEAALILTRLSGLDAAASVSALTAAINSFGGSALQATEIVNKLANVDAAFAVSSADLANALSRVGSSADDAGISFDELIALVTTAQQVTARGGAVIGNSLKTIFTRLGREKTQEVLGGLGIQSTDAEGNVKTQVQLLKELASVYDGLSATQKNYVAEQVGGVFQINVLKAALGDLGKEYSIYDQALKTSLGTTDQAIRRNEKLNETLSARGTRALANIQQAGGNIAGGLFEPAAKNVLNISEFLTGAVNNVDADSIGAKIGSGIISGIGNFIGGPGLALVTAAVVKLFAEFSRYGVEAFKSILGVNQAAKEQAVIQQSVVKFLQNNASIYKAISSGQASVASGAKAYLEIVKQQTIELQKQNSIAAQIAKTTASQVGVQNVGGKSFITQRGSKVKTAAGGFLPHLAAEQNNINNRVGDANPAKDRPVVMKNFPMGNNKKGTMVAHTGEWAVPNYGGGDGTAVWNREMKSKYGLPDGAKKISASGFVPNFAQPKNKKSLPGGTITGVQSSQVANKGLDTYSPFSFDIISIGSRSSFENQFDKQLNNLNSKDSKLSETAVKYFTRNGYSIKQIGQLKQNLLTNKEKVPSLLSGNTKLVNKDRQFTGVKNDLVGKYFERFAANRLGLQVAESKTARMDLLNSKGKPVGEVKFGTIDNDNLISKVIETNYGKSKKQNPPQKDNIFMPSNYKLVVPNAASGFIPNFAKSSKEGDEIIDLGDTRTSKALNGKVVSLIYPNISEGYTMAPGAGSYLGKKYKGLIPVAGINKDVIKGQLPDLKKNLGDLLVREANQFGQVLGGENFLKSPKDLPNYGAAEGAVGVAFEGGLITLLQQGLQKTSQNAGIDFRQERITPRLRKLFHGAPGMYDAKSSSGATNEVMQKLLNEAKPGAVKQVKSGPGFGKVQALRIKAIESIRKEGLVLRRGGARSQFEIEVEKRMAALQSSGAADGFIPAFAANPMMAGRNKFQAQWIKDFVKKNRLPQEALRDPDIVAKLGAIFAKKYPNQQGMFAMASGFIPNFADSPILEQIRNKSSFNFEEIKQKPAVEKRINKLYQQYPDLQYLGSGAESHAFKTGSKVLKLPTLDYKSPMQQRGKLRDIGSIDWAKATRQLKKTDSNLQLLPLRRVSGNSLVTSQRFAGNTFKDEINDYEVEKSLIAIVNSRFESAKRSVSEKPNWLQALALDTASSANFTFMRPLPKEAQIQAREGGISPEGLIKTNKVGLIDPIVFGHMAKRIASESQPNVGKFASGFIPNFVNIQAIQELMKRGATLGERSAAQSALARIQQGSLLKLGTPDKLNKFKELLYGSKSNAGFNLDAIKIGDLKYKPLVQGAKELGLSDKDLQSLASSPMAIKELRNYNQNIRKTSDMAASGFIPNFAKSDQYVKEVIALEESISGKKAVIDDKPFLHVRNKSQPSFASAMRQHGGKNRAMKDSAEMQKGAGLLASSGFIPNFAAGDNETNFTSGATNFTSGATDFTAISASISGLLFSLAFFGGQLDDGAKELRKLKGELKSTGQTLDQAFESNQQRINRQNKLLQKLDVQENKARQDPTLYNAQAGTWTDTGMAGQIEREKRRERVKKDQAKSEERAATIQSAINKRSLTKRERFDEFARNKGLGLGFALQTASGIGSQIAGGDQTVAGSLLTGLGNIGGFAGAGAAVGGGAPGAIIGGIVGAALSAKPIVDALALSINGLGDASQRVQKATENAQRAQESTQGLLIAREKLSDLTESNAPIKDITRAENEYLRQLSKLPPSIQNQISATNDVAKQQEILAKYIQDQTRGANIESLTTDIGKEFITSWTNIGKDQSKKIADSILSTFDYAGGEDVDTKGRIDMLNKVIPSVEKLKGFDAVRIGEEFDNILSMLKEGGEGTAEELEKLKEAFKKASPAELRGLSEDLSKNLKKRLEENQNTLRLEEQSRKNISQLPQVVQDYINNFRKNKNALDNSAKLIGSLNKILKIDIPKFNLGLATQTDTAIMQYRTPSFEQEAAIGAARIDQQSYIDFIEASKEAADTLKGSFVPQLQDNIKNADLTTSANRGEVVDLQNVSEQIAKAVTIEDIQKIDLSKLPKGLQDAYEKSLEDANFNLKQALQNIDFNNAAQKVQQAFDIAVGRFNDRMQKMQGYAGGVSGLSGFDPTQMEGTELRRAYQAGEIGPLKYKREMDKFEREQSIRRLEAMEALGIPENYQRGERSRLTAMLQDQSDEYLDAIGLGNLKGLGRANVVDMVNQQFGGMKPGQKFANPFNQAAEDLVKSIGYVGINMDKFSQQAFTGLQKEADNAAEKLLNLANCAQTAINALCPSTSGGAFSMQSNARGSATTNPPITSTAAASAIKAAMRGAATTGSVSGAGSAGGVGGVSGVGGSSGGNFTIISPAAAKAMEASQAQQDQAVAQNISILKQILNKLPNTNISGASSGPLGKSFQEIIKEIEEKNYQNVVRRKYNYGPDDPGADLLSWGDKYQTHQMFNEEGRMSGQWSQSMTKEQLTQWRADPNNKLAVDAMNKYGKEFADSLKENFSKYLKNELKVEATDTGRSVNQLAVQKSQNANSEIKNVDDFQQQLKSSIDALLAGQKISDDKMISVIQYLRDELKAGNTYDVTSLLSQMPYQAPNASRDGMLNKGIDGTMATDVMPIIKSVLENSLNPFAIKMIGAIDLNGDKIVSALEGSVMLGGSAENMREVLTPRPNFPQFPKPTLPPPQTFTQPDGSQGFYDPNFGEGGAGSVGMPLQAPKPFPYNNPAVSPYVPPTASPFTNRGVNPLVGQFADPQIQSPLQPIGGPLTRPYTPQSPLLSPAFPQFPKPTLPPPKMFPQPDGGLGYYDPNFNPESKPPIGVEPQAPMAPPKNIEQGKEEIRELKKSLDGSREAVNKNSGIVEEQTKQVQESPQREVSQQPVEDGGKEMTLNQDISFPVDISTDFKIDVSMSEEAIAEVGAKISEVQEQLRAELASAIDAVNRQIAGLQTKNGQTA
jgi:TP901 family phage tail tape measure protein